MAASEFRRTPGDRDLFVVGIGASAGGLEAIQTFFDHSGNDTGAAFVVVQHLSPDFESMMAEILSKHTSMAIHTVTEPIDVEPNSIYLIAPKRNLVFRGGKLVPEDVPPHPMLNLPINVFFRSLAENFGERAVAIVLSGTGSDGAIGVKSVRETGGIVMVQDETSARFDGMPHSALATGVVDFVLAPRDMPREIERYLRYESDGTPDVGAASPSSEEDELGEILGLVRRETRVDFTQYKINTIRRRIERRIGLTRSHGVDDYLDLLRSSPEEIRTLGQELLVSVTNFFRDPEAFEVIAREVMPRLVREAGDRGELRIWVAGCATGEEAYTLAILVHEEIERQDRSVPFKIFATDIDRRAIERAASGVYHTGFMSNVSEERARKYFVQRGDDDHVVPAIREKVIFAVHDLVKDPPFTRIDLITCRNLLIYFQPSLQQLAIARILFALRPQGLLFLGPSETTGKHAPSFDTVDARWKILRKRVDARISTPGARHDQIRYPSVPGVDAQAKQRISELERELQSTRESLQATIEELETSNQELQSSNEELHSVNQELHTVNAEYQEKIDELIELNGDMDQLLTSTSVAVLFLDADLRVRRFTRGIADVLHVLERDVGRPIQHLSPRFENEDLLRELECVRSSGRTHEEEIRNDAGRRFVMTIRPHGLRSEHPCGLVVTFLDVSRRQPARGQAEFDRLRLDTALEATGAGTIEWRRTGEPGVEFTGRVATLFGVTPTELPRDLSALGRWMAAFVDPDQRARFAVERQPCFDLGCEDCATSEGSGRADRWRLKTSAGVTRDVAMTCRAIPTPGEANDHVVFVVQEIDA